MFRDIVRFRRIGTYYFFILLTLFHFQASAQSAITSITTSNASVSTNTETNVFSAGFTFSVWVPTANFTVNYSSGPSNDITQITSFTTASFVNIQTVALPGAIAKVIRHANPFIPDTRDFITAWNHISSAPIAGDISGTFNCIAPKIVSMEASLLTNNINSGYDNTFQNTSSQPHYNNIERVDYIIPGGVLPILNLNEMGYGVFDRGIGDNFKIAAITGVDGLNNPTSYSNLITVNTGNFSPAGLLGTGMEYAIFVSDPLAGLGQHRPSTRNIQNIRGVFISFMDFGIVANQLVYGYSLFGQDVDPLLGHILSDPATFPNNTNFLNALDLLNVTGIYKTNNAILPVKASSLSAYQKPGIVVVEWNTAFEETVQQYSLERSNNSVTWDFVQTASPLHLDRDNVYRFIDNKINSHIPGRYFYRVKTTHKNGSVDYSKNVSIAINPEKYMTVTHSGNKIIIHANAGIKQVRLIDIAGRELNSTFYSGSTNIADIQVSSSLHGIYFIKIITRDGEEKTEKLFL